MLVTLGFQSLDICVVFPWAATLWLVKTVHTFLAVMLLVSTTYSTSFPLSVCVCVKPYGSSFIFTKFAYTTVIYLASLTFTTSLVFQS